MLNDIDLALRYDYGAMKIMVDSPNQDELDTLRKEESGGLNKFFMRNGCCGHFFFCYGITMSDIHWVRRGIIWGSAQGYFWTDIISPAWRPDGIKNVDVQ